MAPAIRKRIRHPDKNSQVNGLYVHSSPPRVLQLNPNQIKQWVRNGDTDKLDQIVLEGQGKRLLGEYSPDNKIRTYLKTVPAFMFKIQQTHDAVSGGALGELRNLLAEDGGRRRLASSKDAAGVGLLHKAIYYDLQDVTRYLVDNHPQLVNQKDREGRTPYHYIAACKDPSTVGRLLTGAGADPSVLDNKGHNPQYYVEHPDELELPTAPKTMSFTKKSKDEGLVIKPSSIRIWIHQRDLVKLQQVLWEGHGAKLKVETSNNPTIKKFLEAVPHIMALIRDIHVAVITDNVDLLKQKTEDPIVPVILTSKDANGLTALHKASGLGRMVLVTYIVERCPRTLHMTDKDGRTPLHYSVIPKDFGAMYNMLMEAGSDEAKLDNKLKTAAYYRSRPIDVDNKLLLIVPESPRTATNTFPPSWDWSLLTIENAPKVYKKKENNEEESEKNYTTPKNETLESPTDEKNDDEKLEEAIDDESKTEDVSEMHEKEEEPVTEPNEEETQPNDEETQPNEEETQPNVEEMQSNEEEMQPNDENEEIQDPPDENHNSPSPDILDVEEEREKENLENGIGKDEDQVVVIDEKENDDDNNDDEVITKDHTNDHDTENAIKDEENEEDDDEDRQSERVIEGVVNEEKETLNNDGNGDLEVQRMIEAGDMEMMAALVLSGNGNKLVGKKSDNPELQTFLDNIPSYMDKIQRVHVAARDGDLRELQAALDRRKFAIARDTSSPYGATPLHVAIIFGNTSIVRYLAGRFPETVQVADTNGRTALHYAATLADNGHYYNLLLHLGANAKELDNLGHMAEYYRNNSDEMSHKSLLRDFGATEIIADKMLTDKVGHGDVWSARRNVDEEDIPTLQKCFRVVQTRRGSNVSLDEAYTFRGLVTHCLHQRAFDAVKIRLSRMDHTIYDLIWPCVKKLPLDPDIRIGIAIDFIEGVTAPDYDVFLVFHEFMIPFIKLLHGFIVSAKIIPQPPSLFFTSVEKEKTVVNYDLDPEKRFINDGSVEYTRNFENTELPLNLNIGSLEEVEKVLTAQLFNDEITKILCSSDELEKGTYYTLNEVFDNASEVRIMLEDAGLMIPLWCLESNDNFRLHGKHWPYGRGVFINKREDVAIWINVLDHLRIISSTSEVTAGNIGYCYVKATQLVRYLDDKLKFKKDSIFGFLSARPKCIGNGLKITASLQIPNLIKDLSNLNHLCSTWGLTFYQDDENVICVSNSQSLSTTEIQTFNKFKIAVENLIQLENDQASTNSNNMTSMFVNMFKRKKSPSTETIQKNSEIQFPLFQTEEGRYLAFSLGDPLIKGLTEVANKRPKDPIAYLATYLYNFANNNPRPKTRGSTATRTIEANEGIIAGSGEGQNNNDPPPRTIDVVTLDPEDPTASPDGPESAFSSSDRDEHGQSMVHFAAARTHGRGALLQLLEDADVNIGYRDELYRTARDVSVQAGLSENTAEIDRWVVGIAARGDTNKLLELLLEGYDHILDAVDENQNNILQVVQDRNQSATADFLNSILAFEEKRERVHHAIRNGDIEQTRDFLADVQETGSGHLLARGKNNYGRCALQVAVLCQREEIVDFLANAFPETLKVGDNLERTALHYAMGVDKVETISKVLTKAGAKRVLKDLKGRQPSYYFMNKSDILRLQEEEETF